MRLIYMGTPEFAVPPLQALLKAGHDIAGVVTRTDKPAGRGRGVAAPPVKLFALEAAIPLYQPKRVREPEFIEILKRLVPDAIVVAAYGQILPKSILTLPKYGCINIHASLLPAYRGAAPINWAIIHGDRETGITIMQMDEGMDTGGILQQEAVAIEEDDTTGSLTAKLSALGARMITNVLPLIASGSLTARNQDNTKASLAPLLKKEDGLIDWALPAADIRNRIRGFSPWPGTYTFLEGVMIKIVKAGVRPGSEEPGRLSTDNAGITVGTGQDLLVLHTVQPEGKKAMAAGDFARGHRGLEGKKFTTS